MMWWWTRRGWLVALVAAMVLGGCGDDSGDGGAGATDDAGADVGAPPSDDAGSPDDTGGPGGGDGGEDGGGGGYDAGADAGPTTDVGGGTDADAGPIDLGDPTTGSWSEDFTSRGMGAALGGRVNDLVQAPDGTIYAGGIFEVAGGVPAIGVAAWDGNDWAKLGEGIDAEIDALALSDDGSTLYAAGRPNDGGGGGGGIGIPGGGGGGGAKIWVWDGSIWSEFATVGGDFPEVGAMEILSSGELVVGGWFADIDGTPVDHLAIHDGSTWRAASAQPFNGGVWAIEERLDSYCVGGDFTTIGATTVNYVACWKAGTGWYGLGDGLPGSVHALLDMGDGTMLAGGTLTYMIDPTTLDYVTGLARFDGTSWSEHAGGVDGGFINDVKALEHGPGGSVLVGGTFNLVGRGIQDLPVRNVASLDTSTWTWSTLGLLGVTNSVGVVLGTEPGVNEFLTIGDTVVAGGLFSKADDMSAHNIVLYDWQTKLWTPMVNGTRNYAGLDGTVNALAASPSGEVYATGYFPHAGGDPVNHVARLGAQGWEAMGSGLTNIGFALHHDGQDVYVGGAFANLPNTGASFIARWDGTLWRALGGGVDGPVFDIASDGQGKLYVGGDFTVAGGQPANRIAVWDGTSWSPLGDGLGGRVSTIAIGDDGTVYAGGTFSTLGDGTTEAFAVAAWDGASWSELGGGLFSDDTSGYVSELVDVDGKLFVAGHFDGAAKRSTSPVALNSVGLWTGTAWEPLANGIEPEYPGLPTTMSAANRLGERGIVISGTFREMGGEEYNHLAYWDGAGWVPLGNGLSDLAEDVLVVGRSLYIGGSFTAAGGRPSYGIAVWSW